MGETYKGSGVDYGAMDPFKILAQQFGAMTADNLLQHGCKEVEGIRGESCYLMEFPDFYLSHVIEGLGTLNLVADDMPRRLGTSYYNIAAQATVGMILNDKATVGAQPLSCEMHLAVGDGKWFKDKQRCEELTRGWKHACDLARCSYGGGETPTLRGIILPDAAELSGSAVGIINPKRRLISGNIQEGDVIVFFASGGVMANGLTLCRKLSTRLPKGYLTKLPGGMAYGEALLQPTPIFVGAIMDCLANGIDIHYAINITGHGWRKIMRHSEPFVYVIDKMPDPMPEIFPFIQKTGDISDREMWGNYNMGAGFAVIVPREAAQNVTAIAERNGHHAWVGGYLEKQGDKKRVVIRPVKGLYFRGDTMKIR